MYVMLHCFESPYLFQQFVSTHILGVQPPCFESPYPLLFLLCVLRYLCKLAMHPLCFESPYPCQFGSNRTHNNFSCISSIYAMYAPSMF